MSSFKRSYAREKLLNYYRTNPGQDFPPQNPMRTWAGGWAYENTVDYLKTKKDCRIIFDCNQDEIRRVTTKELEWMTNSYKEGGCPYNAIGIECNWSDDEHPDHPSVEVEHKRASKAEEEEKLWRNLPLNFAEFSPQMDPLPMIATPKETALFNVFKYHNHAILAPAAVNGGISAIISNHFNVEPLNNLSLEDIIEVVGIKEFVGATFQVSRTDDNPNLTFSPTLTSASPAIVKKWVLYKGVHGYFWPMLVVRVLAAFRIHMQSPDNSVWNWDTVYKDKVRLDSIIAGLSNNALRTLLELDGNAWPVCIRHDW